MTRPLRRPYTFKEWVVDWLVLLINRITGSAFELSRVTHVPNPTTLSQELDAMAKVHFALYALRKSEGNNILVELYSITLRPGIGSRLTQKIGEFIVPNSAARAYGVMSGEIRDEIPMRSDNPNAFDFRHCPVTERTWNEIKRLAPNPGATTVSIAITRDTSRQDYGNFIMGDYTIIRGRIELHPTRLIVTMKAV